VAALIDRIKQRWHADLLRNPETHAWVLNLYLNGERYPQTVGDYFQVEYAPNKELGELMTQHAKDEHKHEVLFANALENIGKSVVYLPRQDVFNEIVRSFTPGTFHIQPGDAESVRRFKLANFMTHAHFLEKRVARSLQFHLDGYELAGISGGQFVTGILKDEHRHVNYTKETVCELLTRKQAEEVFDAHRRAEARANLKFSARQVRNFLAAFKSDISRKNRLLFRCCALLMEGAERLG
jgi:hypothetical protein